MESNNFEIPIQLRIAMEGNIEGEFSEKLEKDVLLKNLTNKITLNEGKKIVKLKLQISNNYIIQNNPYSNYIYLTFRNEKKSVQFIIKEPPKLFYK